ncbi:hypothetical protein PPH41_34955, partial [Burkholderia gladioli]|nr:hypothetical protein [Burkholderia gladioli]
MDDTERPTTSGVCEHFPPEPVIIVSQAVAHGLRILEKFVSIQLSDSQYHACTFFHTRPGTAKLRATHSSAGKTMNQTDPNATSQNILVLGAGELGLPVLRNLARRAQD